MTRELRGLTWDHPRWYAPLDALARLDDAGPHRYGRVRAPLRWDRQPLEGFESRPLVTLTGDYDLVFAKARCALEAMAVGAAVVLCDTHGLGPMVTSAA